MSELNKTKEIDLERCKIELYTPKENWIIEEIEKYQLGKTVALNGMISRADVIKKQRTSQILLLLTWNNPEEIGVLTGKIFEYLAAKRPIISIGPKETVISRLLQETGAGIHVSTKEELKDYLRDKYSEFIDIGQVKYDGERDKIMKYSYREMTRKFNEILQDVIR